MIDDRFDGNKGRRKKEEQEDGRLNPGCFALTK